MTDSAPLPAGGVIPPLVTPMLPDRTPDLDSFDRLVAHVVAGGASGILVLGSTGENGLLSSAGARRGRRPCRSSDGAASST